ncbi:multicopper oxidase family protein [Streptomyces chattanoogensis]|uniref:multicopper oxidase family protein n=1 Tax=Streptomyces chattanoogensis TaxID=66876 RepID=UPI0005D986C5|nr:Multicopper oxidase MmcO [Streptomyces lydicus]
MRTQSPQPPSRSRREALGVGAAVAGGSLLAACSGGRSAAQDGLRGTDDGKNGMPHDGAPDDYIRPDGPEVIEAEKERGTDGTVRQFRVTATSSMLDLGGVTVGTWSYGGELPGKEVRVTAGDTLQLTLDNHLPKSTTVHWHGLTLRNDMDGVPAVTQRPIQPGGSFTYKFATTHPGTYWMHPHIGVQIDRGLYAPVIVDDPREPLRYDHEWIVMIDDWLDGVDGSTPDAVLNELNHDRGSSSGHSMERRDGDGDDGHTTRIGPSRVLVGARSRLLGGTAGMVDYPYHLINGCTPENPRIFRAKPGDRIRIRFINASGETGYRVALGDHTMTVTHTDGHPVEHAETDALLLGMSERYDVLVTAKDGVFPLTALAEGKNRTAMAVLRTSGGEAPGPGTRPKELDGTLLTAYEMKAEESDRAARRDVDRTIEVNLTGNMRKFNWAINGKPYTPSQRYPIAGGERVRLAIHNRTKMWHPVHLHGHTFALPDGGPLKDTTIVLPHTSVNVDFDADNPGLWMLHCHNIYHSDSGMMTILGYLKQ